MARAAVAGRVDAPGGYGVRMRVGQPLSAKGERHAQLIVDAALRCLARDGYAATSLQRVADEAGLGKRAVIYYYGSREGLFDHVVRQLGDRLMEQLAEAVEGLEEPSDIVSLGFARFWTAVTTDRALLVAWFGLVAESITNPALHGAAVYVTDRFRALVSGLVDDALARGRVLHMRRESLEVLILTAARGLILEFLERGETPELKAAIEDVQTWLTTVSSAPPAAHRPGSRAKRAR